MIEVGKLYELNGRAISPGTQQIYTSGSWSPGMLTGFSKTPANTLTSNRSQTISSSSYVQGNFQATVSLAYGVMCEEYVDTSSMTIKEISYNHYNKPCIFIPNGTVGLVVQAYSLDGLVKMNFARILIEDRLYVVFQEELKAIS